MRGYYQIILKSPLAQYYNRQLPIVTNERMPVNSIPFDVPKSTDKEPHGLKKPREPGPEDCCMSGCSVCVWDIYNEELENYNKKMGIEEVSSVDVSMNAFLEFEKSLKK